MTKVKGKGNERLVTPMDRRHSGGSRVKDVEIIFANDGDGQD